MKTNTIIIFLLFFNIFSCQYKEKKKIEIPPFKHRYTLIKTDDNNWSHSGRIQCDSFNFITPNHVEFFVDGTKSTIKGKQFRVYTNNNFE